jgi:hypothetical protein
VDADPSRIVSRAQVGPAGGVSPASWLRRAGRTRLPDGSELLWSVAEGERGRRWRASTIVDGAVGLALLLEVDRRGRPTKLELTTAIGMLTLHPEGDERSIHGNVVESDGVRPLALDWGPEQELEVVDDPITAAVMLRRLDKTVAAGEGETISVLAIDARLSVRPETRLVRRLDDRRWEVANLAGGRATTIALDASGIPSFPGGAAEWPIEP